MSRGWGTKVVFLSFLLVFLNISSLVLACGNNEITGFAYPLADWTQVCGFDVHCADDHHMGVDGKPAVGSVVGTKVIAPCSGVVKEARSPDGYGGMVILECWTGSECVSPFAAHMYAATLQVSAGQTVKIGDTLGYLADKTNNGGWEPHSHFGIRRGSYSSFNYSGCTNNNGNPVWSYAAYPDNCYSQIVADMYNPIDFVRDHPPAANPVADILDFWPKVMPTSGSTDMTVKVKNGGEEGKIKVKIVNLPPGWKIDGKEDYEKEIIETVQRGQYAYYRFKITPPALAPSETAKTARLTWEAYRLPWWNFWGVFWEKTDTYDNEVTASPKTSVIAHSESVSPTAVNVGIAFKNLRMTSAKEIPHLDYQRIGVVKFGPNPDFGTDITIVFEAKIPHDVVLPASQYVWSGEKSGSGKSLWVDFHSIGDRTEKLSAMGTTATAMVTVIEVEGPGEYAWAYWNSLFVFPVWEAHDIANDWTKVNEAVLGGGFHNGRADAVKHTYASCLVTIDPFFGSVAFGAYVAEGAGTAHEVSGLGGTYPPNESVMDQENNAIGRSIGMSLSPLSNEGCRDRVVEMLNAGKLTILDDIPNEEGRGLLQPSNK